MYKTELENNYNQSQTAIMKQGQQSLLCLFIYKTALRTLSICYVLAKNAGIIQYLNREFKRDVCRLVDAQVKLKHIWQHGGYFWCWPTARQVVFPLLFGTRTGNLSQSVLKTFSGGLQPCPWSVFLHLLGANAGASGWHLHKSTTKFLEFRYSWS